MGTKRRGLLYYMWRGLRRVKQALPSHDFALRQEKGTQMHLDVAIRKLRIPGRHLAAVQIDPSPALALQFARCLGLRVRLVAATTARGDPAEWPSAGQN